MFELAQRFRDIVMSYKKLGLNPANSLTSKDLFAFLQHQKHTSGPPLNANHPLFFKALDYHAYKNHNMDGYVPINRNSICGDEHPRHPGDRFTKEIYCPVCASKILVAMLHLIYEAWVRIVTDNLGISFKFWADPPPKPARLQKSWHVARKALANWQGILDRCIDIEREWEINNPTADVSKTYSHSKALDIVELGIELYSPGCLLGLDGKMSADWKNKERTKRMTFDTASFTQDTPISSGRRNGKLDRGHRKYTPGKWACPDPGGWADTSWQKSFTSSLQQCKLFVFTDPQYMNNNPPIYGRFMGQVFEYKYCEAVMQFIVDKYYLASSPIDKRWWEGISTHTDAIFLLNPGEVRVNGQVRFHIEGLRAFESKTGDINEIVKEVIMRGTSISSTNTEFSSADSALGDVEGGGPPPDDDTSHEMDVATRHPISILKY